MILTEHTYSLGILMILVRIHIFPLDFNDSMRILIFPKEVAYYLNSLTICIGYYILTLAHFTVPSECKEFADTKAALLCIEELMILRGPGSQLRASEEALMKACLEVFNRFFSDVA